MSKIFTFTDTPLNRLRQILVEFFDDDETYSIEIGKSSEIAKKVGVYLYGTLALDNLANLNISYTEEGEEITSMSLLYTVEIEIRSRELGLTEETAGLMLLGFQKELLEICLEQGLNINRPQTALLQSTITPNLESSTSNAMYLNFTMKTFMQRKKPVDILNTNSIPEIEIFSQNS